MKIEYTGREIAIFADSHSLLEPTFAVLDDAHRRGITEIYSLGDNVGYGPNPREVVEIMDTYGVVSIAGNAEEYVTLGLEPFKSYMVGARVAEQVWVESKLTEEHVSNIKLYKKSIDLLVGGKKVGLCHFANDVRIYFGNYSTWSFQDAIRSGVDPTKQFLHTNSPREILINKERAMVPSKEFEGYRSAVSDPLFGGKTVDKYDEIIQGHVHFGYVHDSEQTRFRTLRAVGMGFAPTERTDMAHYIILKEKEIGYDVEEVYVMFDRVKMIERIIESDMPQKDKIKRFVGM